MTVDLTLGLLFYLFLLKVHLRLLALQQPFDIFLVGNQNQQTNAHAEDDNEVIGIFIKYKGNANEVGKAPANGAERYITGNKQHHHKHRYTQQRSLQINRQHHAKQGGNAFAAPKARKYGEQVAHYRRNAQRKLVTDIVGVRPAGG